MQSRRVVARRSLAWCLSRMRSGRTGRRRADMRASFERPGVRLRRAKEVRGLCGAVLNARWTRSFRGLEGAVYAGTDDTAGGAGGQLRRTEELPDAPLSANRAIPRSMPANTS